MQANAPAPPVPVSYAQWYVQTLTMNNLVLLLMAFFIAMAVILLLLVRGNRFAGSAILLVVPLPLLVGLYGAVEVALSTAIVISRSPGPVNITMADQANGIASMLLPVHSGLLLTVPVFLLALAGLLLRSVGDEPRVKDA